LLGVQLSQVVDDECGCLQKNGSGSWLKP
jgi:hypothetical protein